MAQTILNFLKTGTKSATKETLHKTLFQMDSKGKIRVWEIKVVEISDTLTNIVSYSGQEGGKMIETITPITAGSNVGKANEKSIYEQAIFDAKSEINKKVKSGYVEDKVNLKTKGETATIKAPMKGYAYAPYPDRNNKKDKRLSLDDLGIKNTEVEIQVKLDGWRIRIEIDADNITYYTSSGDVTLEFPQVSASLRKSFDKIKDYVKEKYGVEKYYLDGEIYRHNLNLVKDAKGNIVDYFYKDNTSGFNATASACASIKNLTPIKQALRDEMQFYLFDVCMDAPYTTRKKVLEYFYTDTVLPVISKRINANENEIDELFLEYLEGGYEGLMIRKLDMPYEFKRSKQLTKYKPFEDAEFKIVGFRESVQGNTLGSIEIELEDGSRAFANLKEELGDDGTKLQIWNNQSDYLDKWVTVEFMGYTPDGSLRHPRAKAFRKGKSAD